MAIVNLLRQHGSEQSNSLQNGSVPGSLARIVVGDRAFCIVPLSSAEWDRGQVSFDLCGQTFLVVAEEVADGAALDHDDDIAVRLTERELQITVLVALGNPTKRVAQKLGIGEWTVKEHLRRIFVKLRVHSQAAMVYRCAGLLQRLDRSGHLSEYRLGRT